MTNGLWTYTDIYQWKISQKRIGATSKLFRVKADLDIVPDKFFLVSVMPWQPDVERDEVAASMHDLASGLGIQIQTTTQKIFSLNQGSSFSNGFSWF